MAGRLNRNRNFNKLVDWSEPSGHAVKARNLGDLIRGVHRYRSHHGGDLKGGWENRLQDAICEQDEYKALCLEVDDRESTIESVRHVGRSDVQQFFNVVKRFIEDGGNLVAPEESERRALICSTCPRNVPIKGCMGCSGLIPKLLKLTKGASTIHDAELKGCLVCGCQLKAKVHLPKHVSTGDEVGHDFPDWCWIRDDDGDSVEVNQ